MKSPRPEGRLRRVAGVLVFGLLLGGCRAAAPVTVLDDGTLRVACPGGYHDWSRCEAAARNQCGTGAYQELGRISDEGGNVGSRDWSREGSDVTRSMTFRCLP
ncbi:MAG: hypothetical protein ACO3P1_10325 [Pseudomonadales bacterium]